MKSTLRQIRLSPKKAQLIASMIRKLDATKALSTLKFLDKKAAGIMHKILFSAVSNAENNFAQKKADLFLSKVLVSPWTTYKRWQSRSKWRVFKILKRTSHITIELWVKSIIDVPMATTDNKKEKVDSIKDEKVDATNIKTILDNNNAESTQSTSKADDKSKNSKI